MYERPPVLPIKKRYLPRISGAMGALLLALAYVLDIHYTPGALTLIMGVLFLLWGGALAIYALLHPEWK